MTTIEEGITFILSHFQEPIFPRKIFTPIQKQIKIERYRRNTEVFQRIQVV